MGENKIKVNYKNKFGNKFGKENSNYRHGMSYSRPYHIWTHMIRRCNYLNDDAYKAYGGRGIKVCSRWNKGFINFWKDMKKSYFYGATIERINNDGNYCPENCKWATRSEQSQNRRSTKHIIYNGVAKTIREWSEITGINYRCLKSRFRRNFSPEKALSTPGRHYRFSKQAHEMKLEGWLSAQERPEE